MRHFLALAAVMMASPAWAQDAAIAVQGNPAMPHDLSPMGMFMMADWVVKSVMILLGLASIATWTVWLAKSAQLAAAKRKAGKLLGVVLDAPSLDDALRAAQGQRGAVALMVEGAAEEAHRSAAAIDDAGTVGVKERVHSVLGRIELRAARTITRGMGLLATVGSTAPFIGLFGTVWGIMNAFIGISRSQSTSLAVVAPGIAEALFATAIGLVAAIPAVVFYNMFARSVSGYRLVLGDASAGIERLVSRDLDFRHTQARKAHVAPLRTVQE
jgi:biopolymer transport protein ExbB